MKTVHQYTAKLPAYSLPFLINGDDSNLNSADLAIIEKWYDRLQRKADLFECMIVISAGEGDSYFTTTPEFGLPCDAIDCEVLFLQ